MKLTPADFDNNSNTVLTGASLISSETGLRNLAARRIAGVAAKASF
jgi:hypothetical protein